MKAPDLGTGMFIEAEKVQVWAPPVRMIVAVSSTDYTSNKVWQRYNSVEMDLDAHDYYTCMVVNLLPKSAHGSTNPD